jgi:hypothetical protein
MLGALVRYVLIIGGIVLALWLLGWLEAGRQGVPAGRFKGSSRFTGRGDVGANLRLGAKVGYRLAVRLYHRVTTERLQEMEMIRVAVEAAGVTRQQIGETTVDFGNVLTTASATEYEKMAIEARMPAFKKAVEQALQRRENHHAEVYRTRPCVVDLSNVTVRTYLSDDGHTYAEWSWAGAWHAGRPSRRHSEFVTRLVTDVLEDNDNGYRASAQSARTRPGDTGPRTLTPEDSEVAAEPRVCITGTNVDGTFGMIVVSGLGSQSALIGRDPAADLVLPAEDTRLSRAHVRVLLEAGQILVNDISKQGTWLLEVDGTKRRLVKDRATPLPPGGRLLLTRDESVVITLSWLS